jgi:hypothetical protein
VLESKVTWPVLGVISSTSPGSGSDGQNNGTGANGYGVYGLQNGSGYRVQS